MPAYPGSSLANILANNRQVYLWDDESVPAGATYGSLSWAFQLERHNRSFYPWGFSVEVWFSGAPGTFEIDIMGANNDLMENYVQIGSITAVNSSNVGRWDMASYIWPKYVAAYMKTLTNAVNVTLQASH